MTDNYVQALEDECARANVLIGVLRLAAQGHEMAGPDYSLYRQYLDSRDRRFDVQEGGEFVREEATSQSPVVTPAPTFFDIKDYDSLPATIPEPIYNKDGFGVGFRVVHPPGVECVYPLPTKRCTCGRLDPGVVTSDLEERG